MSHAKPSRQTRMGSLPSNSRSRPLGAMTHAMLEAHQPTRRRLRIARVEGAQLHETTLEDGAPIRLTEAAPDDALVWVDGTVRIRRESFTEARVRVMRLDDAGRIQVEVGEGGRLHIGRETWLFQLIDAPRSGGRSALPARLRRGVFEGVDHAFTTFVVASLFVHLGLIAWMEGSDARIDTELVPDRVAAAIFQEPEALVPDERDPVVEEVEPLHAEADPIELPTPAPTPRAPREVARRRGPGPSRPDDSPALTVGAAADQVREALGTRGVLADLPTSPLRAGEVMSDAAQGQALGSTPAVPATRSGHAPISFDTSLRNLAVGTHEAEEGGTLQEDAPRGRIELEPDDIETSSSAEYDGDAIGVEIARRRAQFNACYVRALRDAPTLEGRISMRFSITEQGTVSGVRVLEDHVGSGTLRGCLEQRIRAIRVRTPPRGGSVELTMPFVFRPG